MKNIRFSFLLALTALALTPSLAHAHSTEGATGGFVSGFLHPVFGLDHVVAMVAVGLWGAVLGAPAIWILPVTFPLVMAVGGVFGVMGVPIPGVETCIALSGVLLGAMVAFAVRPPIGYAVALIGFFGFFHGYAHGAELPEAANAVTYAIGFVLATGLLHLCGIAIGLLIRWPVGFVAVRGLGVVVSLIGFGFLFGFL